MYVLNGKVLQPGKAFNYKGLQYPSDWLAKSTAAQRAQVGIVTRSKGTPKITPKSPEDERKSLISQQNQAISQRLEPTDWYWIRKMETGVDIPTHILEYRAQVRKVYQSNMGQIEVSADPKSLKLEQYPTL